MMLFIRLSCPANVPELPYCGVNRVMSLIRPDTVGRTAISLRFTAVAAPVRVELNTALVSPTTVTVSATVATASLNGMSWTTPSVSEMPFCAADWNPGSEVVMV